MSVLVNPTLYSVHRIIYHMMHMMKLYPVHRIIYHMMNGYSLRQDQQNDENGEMK